MPTNTTDNKQKPVTDSKTEQQKGEKETKNNLAVLEDDDEFEEFPVEDWNEAENNQDANLWDDNWDDDDIEDDFSKQLKEELSKADNKMQS